MLGSAMQAEPRQRASHPQPSGTPDLPSPFHSSYQPAEISSPVKRTGHQTFRNGSITSLGQLAPPWNQETRPYRGQGLSALFTIPSYSTIRFVLLCLLWYSSSAISSNTGKVILNRFRFPVTLTTVQFFFVAGWCIVCSRKELGWTARLRTPTQAILRGTLPMAAFQVGGHILSSLAISRVPVSTVHTIKALSPLVTVATYAALFGVSYSPATYLSLLPLTIGVMLACSADFSLSNFFGLICAFGSTLVFVSQNIFFKKIMPTNAEISLGPKLDKINLLFFSSGMALILMIPVWLYSDGWRLFFQPTPLTTGPVVVYFFINGTVHFAQNILAFAILSSTSPVTYSIASLVKRIAVICLAIIWFNQSVHWAQSIGIGLTGVGLWLYNNAKRDVESGEIKMRQHESLREGLLPLSSSGFEKDVHNSPRPSHTEEFPPTSSSSAIRPGQYQMSTPKANGHAPPPATPPATEARHRRPSLDSNDAPPYLKTLGARPPTIAEEPKSILA